MKIDNPQGDASLAIDKSKLDVTSSLVDGMRCRYYIKVTATISDGDKNLSTVAYARESLSKAGMDASQITGSASSYARKYALGGLLAIDDEKDADSRDNSSKTKVTTKAPTKVTGKPVTKDISPEKRRK